jgi:hypothetical protein
MTLIQAQKIGNRVLSKLSEEDVCLNFWEIAEQLYAQIIIEGSLK